MTFRCIPDRVWIQTERHHGPVYDWVISREDTHGGGGPYTTGVRIQTFTGVKEGTGKSAKEFILDFLAGKKKEANKIVKTCEEKDQGLFTRICLETEEGVFARSAETKRRWAGPPLSTAFIHLLKNYG